MGDIEINCVILQQTRNRIMARPIKETPTLYGADARRFEQLIANPKPLSKEVCERMLRNYEAIKAIATFPV